MVRIKQQADQKRWGRKTSQARILPSFPNSQWHLSLGPIRTPAHEYAIFTQGMSAEDLSPGEASPRELASAEPIMLEKWSTVKYGGEIHVFGTSTARPRSAGKHSLATPEEYLAQSKQVAT